MVTTLSISERLSGICGVAAKCKKDAGIEPELMS
jgi:hypothetical protein